MAVWKTFPQGPMPGGSFREDWSKRSDEILFPSRHVSYLPWEPYDWENVPNIPGFRNVQIPIRSLCHVTHNRQFIEIVSEQPGSFILKSHRKVGKSGYFNYDGSPVGHSFVAAEADGIPHDRSLYHCVGPEDNLLPGSFIWWSVDINDPLNPPPGFRTSPLFNPHNSPYGRNKIWGSFKDVLSAYQESFPCDEQGRYPTIQLRVGGTKRYKCEVCYVVIACATYRDREPPLDNDVYPIWPPGRNMIRFNEDTNKVEWVDDIWITIRNSINFQDATPQHCKQFFSWDQYVFALHFNDDQHRMICQQSSFMHTGLFQHYCLRKIPHPHDRYNWVCPDEIQ